MIKWLFSTLSVVILATFAIGWYLQPSDFVGCGEKPDMSPTASRCLQADAAVAISGGDTNARVEQAIKLYKNGWVKKLIFSGAAQDKTGPSNAFVMKTQAIKDGVDEDDIYIDENANTTSENAINSQTIFSVAQIDSAILVTSGYHQRRASLEFTRYTHNVKIFNYPVVDDGDWNAFTWWTTPRGWWLAGGELVKIAVFYITGAMQS